MCYSLCLEDCLVKSYPSFKVLLKCLAWSLLAPYNGLFFRVIYHNF